MKSWSRILKMYFNSLYLQLWISIKYIFRSVWWFISVYDDLWNAVWWFISVYDDLFQCMMI